MRPVVTPSQLRNTIRMRVADAWAEGFIVGLSLASFTFVLFF